MPKNFPLFINIGHGLSIMTGLPTIISWNTANRPKRAPKGTFGFNLQTKNLEYYDGTAWFKASMG